MWTLKREDLSLKKVYIRKQKTIRLANELYLRL